MHWMIFANLLSSLFGWQLQLSNCQPAKSYITWFDECNRNLVRVPSELQIFLTGGIFGFGEKKKELVKEVVELG